MATGMYGSDRTAEQWHLVRKVFLLLLLVVATAFGLVYLLDRGQRAPMTMFNLLADGSIGAIMGLGTRMVLRRRHWLIQALVSASLSIVGLIVLGALSGARSGIGPLALSFQRVNWLDRAGIALRLPILPGNSPTDLLDVAHMVIAMDLSWVALRAWRGGTRIRASRPASGSWARPVAVAPISTPAPMRYAAAAPVSTPVVRPITRSRSHPMVKHKRVGRLLITKAVPIRPRNGRLRRRNLFQKRAEVQLAAYEEHRCPYCLEDVKRNDIRGAVECPVCHTLHHKDCWDITGTCQVPHLNG